MLDPDTERRLMNAASILIALLILVLLAFAIAQRATGSPAPLSGSAKRNITATWNFNYTPMPACGTAKAVCVSGFQVGIWTAPTCSNIVRVPNPSNAAGQVNGIKSTFKVAAPPSAVFCVMSTWLDYSGTLNLGAAVVEGAAAPANKAQPAGRVSGLKIER